MSLLETQAKNILIGLMCNALVISDTTKGQIISAFVGDSTPGNMSFQMSFNSLKQSLQDNDSENVQLPNIIMYATGCVSCIKSCLFP